MVVCGPAAVRLADSHAERACPGSNDPIPSSVAPGSDTPNPEREKVELGIVPVVGEVCSIAGVAVRQNIWLFAGDAEGSKPTTGGAEM